MDLLPLIHDVADFPKAGIVFKDITPLLAEPAALAEAVARMAAPFEGRGIERVVGAESRGFIFGTAIAGTLGAGFVPVRKPGKLPRAKHAIRYGLEYGTDTLEIHEDAVRPGQRVLMVDDLLATGGTMRACCDLIGRLGGEIAGISVLIELTDLGGRSLLDGLEPIHAVVRY